MKPYVFLIFVLLGACTILPQAMRDMHVTDISYDQVNQNIDSHRGVHLRWGGIIYDIRNLQDFSLVQILFYPLNYIERPDLRNPQKGLFVIKSTDPLDPKTYVKGKEITVVGILNGDIKLTTEKEKVQVPLLLSKAIFLWPEYYHKDYYDDEGYGGRYIGLGGCGLHVCYGYEDYPVVQGRYYLPYRY